MTTNWKEKLRRLRPAPQMLFLAAVIFLAPLAALPALAGEGRYAWCFWATALIAASSGVVLQLYSRLVLVKRRCARRQGRQSAVVMVMFVWLFIMTLGSLPFVFGGIMRPVPALFESVSGWTTTGFTALPDIDATPKLFLLYRGWMQFCGGLGFVILLLLFSGGREAMNLFSAEGHSDLIEPNLIATARAMMYIYLGMEAAGVALYMLFGMHWLDAAVHTMAALGTGGFSTRSQNIGHYNSVGIEVVSMVLMLLGATNFAALALVFKRKWKRVARLRDIGFFLVVLGAAILTIAVLGVGGIYATFGESLRNAAFTAVSSATTTGFSIGDASHWKPAMAYLIFVLMFLGGASGSTAGGIKYTRVYILLKYYVHHFRGKFLPERSVQTLHVEGVNGTVRVSETAVAQHQRVALLYFATFFIGSFFLALSGMPMEVAMYDFASALGTIGFSKGGTGAHSSDYVLIVQTVGMVFARMEVYMVYTVLFAGLRKMKHSLMRRKKHGRGM